MAAHKWFDPVLAI